MSEEMSKLLKSCIEGPAASAASIPDLDSIYTRFPCQGDRIAKEAIAVQQWGRNLTLASVGRTDTIGRTEEVQPERYSSTDQGDQESKFRFIQLQFEDQSRQSFRNQQPASMAEHSNDTPSSTPFLAAGISSHSSALINTKIYGKLEPHNGPQFKGGNVTKCLQDFNFGADRVE
jgi:hypothetical protein